MLPHIRIIFLPGYCCLHSRGAMETHRTWDQSRPSLNRSFAIFMTVKGTGLKLCSTFIICDSCIWLCDVRVSSLNTFRKRLNFSRLVQSECRFRHSYIGYSGFWPTYASSTGNYIEWIDDNLWLVKNVHMFIWQVSAAIFAGTFLIPLFTRVNTVKTLGPWFAL